MKTTKQVKKIAEVVTLLKKYPDLTASRVSQEVLCSQQYAYLLLKKARESIANPKLRLQKVREMNDMKVLILDSAPPAHEVVNTPAIDMVNHPAHYKVGGIETIDFIQAKLTPEEFRGYLKGNVLKYTSRAGHKGDIDTDIGKMVWYANRLQSTK
jgi:hypothetical protein